MNLRYGIWVISLVLPTYNEAENLPELLPNLKKALAKLDHEVIIVDDDSPDLTWKVAQKLALKHKELHVIRRIGRRGLSSAVIEGFLASKGDVLAAMDADGQHDTMLVSRLAASVKKSKGIAIGSRYITGGSVGEWDERRYILSRIATALAKRLCKVKVHDPMSGFFAIERTLFESVLPKLNQKGFKILLDLLVHVPRMTKVQELPFTFSKRLHGESKLSRRVQIEFLEYLWDVAFGKYIPLVFLKYCMVGFLGVFVNVGSFSIYGALLSQGPVTTIGNVSTALIAAIETSIIFNFWLNNIWTFGHARLRGAHILAGFLKYNGACLLGALANYAVTLFLIFTFGVPKLPAAIFGAFVGVAWNYTMSRMLTWKA